MFALQTRLTVFSAPPLTPHLVRGEVVCKRDVEEEGEEVRHEFNGKMLNQKSSCDQHALKMSEWLAE